MGCNALLRDGQKRWLLYWILCNHMTIWQLTGHTDCFTVKLSLMLNKWSGLLYKWSRPAPVLETLSAYWSMLSGCSFCWAVSPEFHASRCIWDVLHQIKWPGAKIGWSLTVFFYILWLSYGVAIWFCWLQVVFIKHGKIFASFLKFNMGPMGGSDVIHFNFEAFPYYVPHWTIPT